MTAKQQGDLPNTGDPLIDEVRGIRRRLCAQFENNVDRLFDHLKQVERDHAARSGVFACVNQERAEDVVKTWGETVHSRDDALIDEVRAIRKKLADTA